MWAAADRPHALLQQRGRGRLVDSAVAAPLVHGRRRGRRQAVDAVGAAIEEEGDEQAWTRAAPPLSTDAVD
jgi:hypothetical protein